MHGDVVPAEDGIPFGLLSGRGWGLSPPGFRQQVAFFCNLVARSEEWDSGLARWTARARRVAHRPTPARGHAAAGRAEQAELIFENLGGKDHGAQRSGPRPGNEVFALRDKTGTRQCLVAVTGIRLQCVSTPTGHQGRWHNTLSASSATRVWRAEPVIRAGIVEGGFDLE